MIAKNKKSFPVKDPLMVKYSRQLTHKLKLHSCTRLPTLNIDSCNVSRFLKINFEVTPFVEPRWLTMDVNYLSKNAIDFPLVPLFQNEYRLRGCLLKTPYTTIRASLDCILVCNHYGVGNFLLQVN